MGARRVHPDDPVFRIPHASISLRRFERARNHSVRRGLITSAVWPQSPSVGCGTRTRHDAEQIIVANSSGVKNSACRTAEQPRVSIATDTAQRSEHLFQDLANRKKSCPRLQNFVCTGCRHSRRFSREWTDPRLASRKRRESKGFVHLSRRRVPLVDRARHPEAGMPPADPTQTVHE